MALLCVFQVHRLVIVDEQEVVKGIVSLSDILQALVLTDGEEGKYSCVDYTCRRFLVVLTLNMFIIFDLSLHRHSLRK